MDAPEEAEQEQHERVAAFKKGVMDLSVKLQKEQAALMQDIIELVPCHVEDDRTGQRTQSAQAEEVEKANLRLQRLQMELMQQALSLKKAPTKYQWCKTQMDREPQTELEDRDILLLVIQ